MAVTAEQLVAVYYKIAKRRSEIAKVFESEDESLKAQQTMILNELQEMCKTLGVEGFKTPHGVVSRIVKTRYWTSDWGSMYAFIKEHDAFHLLEQKLHQSNTKALLSGNPDLLPPGLNSDSRYVISITKK